jgi:ribonuclease HI
MTDHVVIHTDGACSGNPGPGGWGAVLQHGTTVKELKGGARETTNNKMELTERVRFFPRFEMVCSGVVFSLFSVPSRLLNLGVGLHSIAS